MQKTALLRFRGIKANSTMVGGVIVLSLLLASLGTSIFVFTQYDQYQQLANKMGQLSHQQLSENLAAISPGLSLDLIYSSISGWGSGCMTTYNCYNATISNLGTVGVLIVEIYVNSTGPAGSGCSQPNPQPCIIKPSLAISAYSFDEAEAFINPGETNHQLIFALPSAVSLPAPNPGYPENTILMVTSRGNVFAFQWPLQPQVFGQSQAAFSTGIMKVAYTGTSYDSKNEPGLGGSGGSGYCHNEPAKSYPASTGYAEELTGLTGYGDSGVLWFVNPWITTTILESTGTTLYIYVIFINTGTTSYSPTAGSIDLTWYGSNHLDGSLIGVYYGGKFYTTSPSIASGAR